MVEKLSTKQMLDKKKEKHYMKNKINNEQSFFSFFKFYFSNIYILINRIRKKKL